MEDSNVHDSPAAPASGRAATGFYCSTSGTYFTDKESLSDHYKSDFHRYNLKRKVAGLPAVTKEWFDARKAQLSSVSSTAGVPGQKVWVDPLTKKKFMSENTYQAHVRSKKYQDLVRASGAAAPAPVMMVRAAEPAAAPSAVAPSAAPQLAAPRKAVHQQPGGYTVRPARRPTAAAAGDAEDDDDDSGWETASDVSTTEALEPPTAGTGAAAAAAAAGDGSDEEGEEGEWEEWDVRQSLFDGRVAASFEDNLEYMYKTYGFYLPEASFLVDPQGLVRYLGQKLRYGGIPLGVPGDDTNARRFRSLHGVQRHMVDTNQCKLAWEDNEDEYADFYNWGDDEDGTEAEDGDGSRVLTLSTADAGPAAPAYVSGGYELVVGGGDGGSGNGSSGKVIGSREFARYYRQRPKPQLRADVEVNALVARYRSLGIDTRPPGPTPEVGRAQKEVRRFERHKLNMALRRNKNDNLPNNVPY